MTEQAVIYFFISLFLKLDLLFHVFGQTVMAGYAVGRVHGYPRGLFRISFTVMPKLCRKS